MLREEWLCRKLVVFVAKLFFSLLAKGGVWNFWLPLHGNMKTGPKHYQSASNSAQSSGPKHTIKSSFFPWFIAISWPRRHYQYPEPKPHHTQPAPTEPNAVQIGPNPCQWLLVAAIAPTLGFWGAGVAPKQPLTQPTTPPNP